MVLKIKPNQKFVKNYSKNVPMKRMAYLNEIVETVIFLVEICNHMTGQNLITMRA